MTAGYVQWDRWLAANRLRFADVQPRATEMSSREILEELGVLRLPVELPPGVTVTTRVKSVTTTRPRNNKLTRGESCWKKHSHRKGKPSRRCTCECLYCRPELHLSVPTDRLAALAAKVAERRVRSEEAT